MFDIGLSIELFFTEHLLSCFSNLFNFSTLYRVWDVLFFYASDENKVENFANLTVIFTLLDLAQNDILKAKDINQITFIIDLYAKFLIQPDDFINKYL